MTDSSKNVSLEYINIRIGWFNRSINDFEYRQTQIHCLGEIARELAEAHEAQLENLRGQINEIQIDLANAMRSRS